MSVWAWSAEVGIVFGVAVFTLTFLPVVAFQYRKYGRFTLLRLLGAGAVSVYITTVIAYTLLPLPASREVTCVDGPQLIPMHFLADFAAEHAGSGPQALLTSRALLQFFFNVMLFVPLGIMVRGFFARSLPVAVAVGLGTSLLIETTQLTGIWGIYSCAYRLADIDDILANTAGAVIGGLLAPIVLSWMPSERTFRATRGDARPVTAWRRWLGMAIDFALFSALGSVLIVCYRVILLAAAREVPPVPNVVEATLGSLVPALLVFVAPAARRSGATLGQSAVWLVPHWTHPASVARRMVRAASVGGLYGVLVFASHLPWGLAPAAGAASVVVVAAAVVSVPLTRGRGGLSGLFAGATMSDERSVELRS